jgi:ADP-ribose pyrophosphatase YjhB (NUDIX family)
MAEERPDLTTDAGRLAAIRMLNARLPRTRLIAQGLLRNESGEILLCQLTNKREWDLPGGVVDPHESPATCVTREIEEELGVAVRVERLLAVNWLPPWRGWDDAMLFLFDLGVAPAALLDEANLLPREIKAAHWRTLDAARSRLAPYTTRMLEVVQGLEHPAYLENSELTRHP